MSDNFLTHKAVLQRREEALAGKNVFSRNNKVVVSGTIDAEFEYSHKVMWEEFYKTRIKVLRKSGTYDFVPIVVSKVLIQEALKTTNEGRFIEVAGQFRTFNKMGEDGKRHLNMYAFVKDINICDDESKLSEAVDCNQIYLDGYICKSPVYRKTPLGREITEVLIAVNMGYDKSAYIPCIAWGRVAKWASMLPIGSRIQTFGRIQSREYKKFSITSDGWENKTAYEISISQIERVEDSQASN